MLHLRPFGKILDSVYPRHEKIASIMNADRWPSIAIILLEFTADFSRRWSHMVKTLLRCVIAISTLVISGRVHAQSSTPPRFDELPRLAEKWPPKWAALAREIVPARENFEKGVLASVEALLHEQKPTEEIYQLA